MNDIVWIPANGFFSALCLVRLFQLQCRKVQWCKSIVSLLTFLSRFVNHKKNLGAPSLQSNSNCQSVQKDICCHCSSFDSQLETKQRNTDWLWWKIYKIQPSWQINTSRIAASFKLLLNDSQNLFYRNGRLRTLESIEMPLS